MGCLSSIHYGSLKAIHNPRRTDDYQLPVFILYPLWKFESNSQLRSTGLSSSIRCLSSIHYGSLKAIHNMGLAFLPLPGVFILYPLWKFESNSQHHHLRQAKDRRCLSSIHYGSLKAIHNLLSSHEHGLPVFILYPLWKFESNSQPIRHSSSSRAGVFPLSIMEV